LHFPGWEGLEKFLPGYTYRPGQARLSDAIAEAFTGGEILIAEAGTGTGKTLAYLIPLVIYAIEHETRVAISTDTRALQTQLLEKDIPLVERILGRSLQAELCLGASNYVCKRKLGDAVNQGGLLLAGEELDSFLDWEKVTSTGIRSDFTGQMPDSIWPAVTREADNCLGRRCPNFETSYYFVAREKWKKAQILVLNHALLANHLLLERKLLPEFEVVVIDEAHRFGDAVADALDQAVVLADLAGTLRAARHGADQAGRALEGFRREVETRFTQPTRLTDALSIRSGISLAHALKHVEERLTDELKEPTEAPRNSQELRIQMHLGRVVQARAVVESFLDGPGTGYVHWITPQDSRRGPVLHRSPIRASGFVRDELLSKMRSTIFASATLSASGNKPFSYFVQETGADRVEKIVKYHKVSSPFDYPSQAVLFLPPDIVEPSDDERFPQDCAYWIDRLVGITGGGAFVLFTSRVSLSRTHALLEASPDASKLTLISQLEHGPRSSLRMFREKENAVLLGLATFWHGIDIPGDRLRLVILVKLPFQVPDEPVLAARMEALTKEGKSPFTYLQLPHAVLSMKQGFGRLIRRESDRGIVAVLDSRIQTRHYGKEILKALPPARVVRDLAVLETEYARLFGETNRPLIPIIKE